MPTAPTRRAALRTAFDACSAGCCIVYAEHVSQPQRLSARCIAMEASCPTCAQADCKPEPCLPAQGFEEVIPFECAMCCPCISHSQPCARAYEYLPCVAFSLASHFTAPHSVEILFGHELLSCLLKAALTIG